MERRERHEQGVKVNEMNRGRGERLEHIMSLSLPSLHGRPLAVRQMVRATLVLSVPLLACEQALYALEIVLVRIPARIVASELHHQAVLRASDAALLSQAHLPDLSPVLWLDTAPVPQQYLQAAWADRRTPACTFGCTQVAKQSRVPCMVPGVRKREGGRHGQRRTTRTEGEGERHERHGGRHSCPAFAALVSSGYTTGDNGFISLIPSSHSGLC
jgi:hypothetical protein